MNSLAANPAAVVADGVVKQFGRFAALRGVTTEFASGKMHVILGGNGAGKTTLLRVIAGLAQPTRGTVRVLGTATLKDIRAHIGYMAHSSLLYDDMSGLENLRYFAALYGIRGDRACEEAIRRVGLDPALPRHVGQYSQGISLAGLAPLVGVAALLLFWGRMPQTASATPSPSAGPR